MSIETKLSLSDSISKSCILFLIVVASGGEPSFFHLVLPWLLVTICNIHSLDLTARGIVASLGSYGDCLPSLLE